jgi:DNA-binding XRE family transcriptional regulator
VYPARYKTALNWDPHPPGCAVTSGETASHLRAASDGGILGGRVGGAVLAAIRTQISATQEELAERTGVSPTTVQAWERGRKPLVNMPFARLRNLRRDLEAAGAPQASWRCGTERWTRT